MSNWQNDPVGVKQIDWIKRVLNGNVVGPQLTEQAVAFLADYEKDPQGCTKGQASELLDKLFKTPRKGDDLPQGIYRQGDNVFIIRPNKKYLDNPSQQGAGLYAMALVPAPHAGATRYELVFDPEAKGKLAKGDMTDMAGIADLLPMCGSRAKKTLQSLAA